MSLSVNWATKTVVSTASILDLPAFREAIRDLEASATGILYDAIITYSKLDLGNGGYFHAVDFINNYRLEFSGTGPFEITGNLGCDLIDTGVQIERKTSAAFATTAEGGGGAVASNPWEEVIEGSLSAKDVMRIMLSVLAGKTTGAGGSTMSFRDIADAKSRVVATLDTDGNRTAITRDPST